LFLRLAAGIVLAFFVAACSGGTDDGATVIDPSSGSATGDSSVSSGSAADADFSAVRSVGDCFLSTEALGDGQPALPCSEMHLFEVFDTLQLRDASFPGQQALGAEGRDLCRSRFRDATGAHFETVLVTVLWVHPSEETWSNGDRRISCVVQLNQPSAITFAELNPQRVGGQVSYFGLQEGDCLPPLDFSLIGSSLAPCDQAHSHEVYANTQLEGDWPGTNELNRISVEFCAASLDQFLGGPRNDVRWEPVPPQNEFTWSEWGDRNLACLLSFDQPVEGSFRGTGDSASTIQPSNSAFSASTFEGNTLTLTEATSSAIALGWSRIPAVQDHVLFRTTAAQASTSDPAGWVGIQEIYRGDDLEFVDTTVAAGERYVYIVVGQEESGASTEAVWRVALATDDTSPPTFTGELFSELSDNGVVIRWPEATDDTEVVRYEVRRSDDGGPPSLLAQGRGSTEIVDVELPEDGTIVYSITATDLHGNQSAPLTAEFTLFN